MKMPDDTECSEKGALAARLSPLILGFLMTLYYPSFLQRTHNAEFYLTAFCVESAESLVLAKVLQCFFGRSCPYFSIPSKRQDGIS